MNIAAFEPIELGAMSMLVAFQSHPILHCACTRAFPSAKLEEARYTARFADKLAFTGWTKLHVRFAASVWFNEHRW